MAPAVSSEESIRRTPTNGMTKKTFVTPDPSSSSPSSATSPLLTVDKEAFLNEAVKEPGENDVLCGRGGSINSHPGNERFRTLVEKRKRVYLTARFKREKRLIASSIVSEIRALNPPGRFLSRETKTGLWKDIGDEKARDKTSQALRENAPSIRAEIETEINEQRAEMQREEEEAARASVAQQATHPAYYNHGWGYHSYYGYGPHGSAPPPPPPHGHHHHSPPPPPPPSAPHHPHHPQPQPQPHPHPHPHPHHPGHPSYHPPGHYEGTWAPPPPPTGSYTNYYHAPPHHEQHPQPQKSAVQQTADFVSSGAEAIRNWGKSSRSSYRDVSSTSSHDGVDSRSIGSANSKPIVYVHEDEHKKRRMVKFSDDSKYRRKRSPRPSYSPVHSNSSVAGNASHNSLMDGIEDIEPHDLDGGEEQNSSLMNQVASHILGSIGSWDGAAVVCGQDKSDEKAPATWKKGSSKSSSSRVSGVPAVAQREETVEWEGQEVQLLDRKNEHDSVSSDERMPPPAGRQRRSMEQQQQPVPDMASSLGFSSLGSCHSWLPEQFGSAASSFFSYTKNGGVSPVGSMDMEYSTGGVTENSQGCSLGGGSLTRVFETDNSSEHQPAAHQQQQQQQQTTSPMSQQVLNQVPSWERSLLSKSPLSIGSDDESVVSKSTSSKTGEPLPSPAIFPDGDHNADTGNEDMVCE